MSAMANTTPIVTIVTKPVTNPRDADATPRVNIQDFCEEYYEDILPIIMENVRCDKRKEVHARLDFEEGSRERRTREGSHYSSARTLSASPERLKVRDRLRYNDGYVLDRLGHRRQSTFDRLSETYSPSTTKSIPGRTSSRDRSRGRSHPHRLDASNGDRPVNKECFRGIGESYDNSHSSYGTRINHRYRYHDRDRSRHMKRGRGSESPLSSVSKKVDPFTPRIRNFKNSRKTRMPNNVKTYDGTADPEDHVKNFQAAAQVERWAMPTWCHMLNSTQIGAARVWFDELPQESIDSYKDLKTDFLAYFMQQKKYVKDPVEIHNIKQKDKETIKDFMERFKVETGRMKGAPECMRISGFMHGVNNPELTKRLNEHVPKTMKEIMITTTAFIRGEAAAASKKKGHTSWRTHDQSKWQTSKKRSDFCGQPREGRGSSRFTPLTRTPKEILTAESGKFQPPLPMVTLVEKRSNNKFCDFHNDKGHSTDESKIGGHMIIRMYVNGGSSTEVLYEHCFNWLRPEVKNQMVPTTTSSTSFSGETIWPLGQLRLLVTIGDADHTTRAWMNFMIVRSLSLYNGIIRRHGIKEIQAVPFTAHEMLKFPADGGLVTIRSTILIPADGSTSNFPDQEVAIEGTLSAKGRTKLCSLLKENLDIFAWQPPDMKRVPRLVAEHWLNILEGYSPVRQKKGPGPKTRQGHPSRDFTDLNKACPQDCYPLPEIDWKVESLCGYPFKCFLDTYKGYHQIQLAESDEEKTAFHTGQGVYCYTKMPFGLKNAGATYHRLVDKGFDNQIGWNIEVYVDDLVIKSHTEAEMLRDISETFLTLRKINMKLNSKKCTFGAVEGMFLGYMITPKGIKPCPDKTEAVPQLSSPWTIKDVQSLNGKLASLNRFLSKSAEKSLPLFKTLKKCIRKNDFHWTSEAEQAFKQLNQHLSELPLLVAPKPKEELIVYLSASNGAISAVLMTERGMVQMPVYFVIRALQDPKLNYIPMEKLVLSLVFAAKRLRRTITKIECHAGRTQYQIPAKDVEPWTLFTDGSSCVDGSGARLILTSLEGTKFTYVLRFQFAASNNKAEYEALIAGLRIAAQIGVQNVHVSVDSKLVVNQVLGAYVAKDENMIKYLKKVKDLKILKEKSIQEKEVTTVVEEDGPTWMTLIMEYLKEGTLPSDRKEARKLRVKARQYELLEGVLYRRSFLTSWLRCVGPLQAEYVIKEIHEGSCNMHAGPQSVVAKAIRLGYYWPTMHLDARDMIPGPFPKGPDKVKILIVSMDYFTKWIEAKAVETITGNQVKKFVWDNIMCCFGLPGEIVLDNGKQFSDNPFKDWPGDFVYRSNDASHAVDGGKLGPKWEGPYESHVSCMDSNYN
nr:reverse transcriptase domain-containing protein [Tanacetum cinerariifolium]